MNIHEILIPVTFNGFPETLNGGTMLLNAPHWAHLQRDLHRLEHRALRRERAVLSRTARHHRVGLRRLERSTHCLYLGAAFLEGHGFHSIAAGALALIVATVYFFRLED